MHEIDNDLYIASLRATFNIEDLDVEFDEPLGDHGTIFELVEGSDGKRYRPPKSMKSDSSDLEFDLREDDKKRWPYQFGHQWAVQEKGSINELPSFL